MTKRLSHKGDVNGLVQISGFDCRRKSPPVGGDFRRQTKPVTCKCFDKEWDGGVGLVLCANCHKCKYEGNPHSWIMGLNKVY